MDFAGAMQPEQLRPPGRDSIKNNIEMRRAVLRQGVLGLTELKCGAGAEAVLLEQSRVLLAAIRHRRPRLHSGELSGGHSRPRGCLRKHCCRRERIFADPQRQDQRREGGALHQNRCQDDGEGCYQNEIAAGKLLRQCERRGEAHDAAHSRPAHDQRHGYGGWGIPTAERGDEPARQVGRRQDPNEAGDDYGRDDRPHRPQQNRDGVQIPPR
jgi:hypothetical protein